MKLEIALQNYKYERRLCWLLSSLIQADQPKAMEIVVRVGYIPNTGSPCFKDVEEHFAKKGVVFDNLEFKDDSMMRFRSELRNMLMATSKGDWILFGDADMLYPKTWFTTLETCLADTHKNSRKCLFGARKSVPILDAEKEVAMFQYPCEVPDAFMRADKYNCKEQVVRAVGNCQIANVQVVREDHKGLYAEGVRDGDWNRRKMLTRADIRFRMKMGQDLLPLPLQIHLNHHRDAGVHTGQQK